MSDPQMQHSAPTTLPLLGIGVAIPLEDDVSPKPRGDQIYDALMADIDPRLTTDALDATLQIGPDGRPTRKLTREEREAFRASFAEYDKRFSQLKVSMEEAAKTERRQRLKTAEESEVENDQSML